MENTANNGKKIAESSIFKKILARAEEYAKKPLRVKELLNDAYKKASDKKDVGTIAQEAWDSLQTLSRLIKAAVSGEYTGIPTSTIVGGIAVVLYFLSPIDFVPDFIPIIGLLDDVALLAWFMTSIKGEMDKFEEWERSNQATVAASAAGNASYTGASSSTVDPSPFTPKYETYVNHEASQNPTTAGANPVEQVPITQPNETVQVKDFTAHDLDTSTEPNDSAIRASSSGSGEPNVRAATTDGTRIPSSNDDDARTGGNVR